MTRHTTDSRIFHAKGIFILAASLLILCNFVSIGMAEPVETASIQNEEVLISSLSEDAASLASLDREARLAFDQGKYAQAEELYGTYELIVKKLGYEGLPPQLLMNEALVSYHKRDFALALARLKQYSLTETDREAIEMMGQLERLIELQAHESRPNVSFVRGETNEYMLWAWCQYRSLAEQRIIAFAAVFGLFVTLGVLLYAKRQVIRNILWIIVICCLVTVAVAIIVRMASLHTKDLQFAVLLNADVVRNLPMSDAPIAHEHAFLPGLTVKVLSERDTWTLIERSDNQTVWVPNEALYRLQPHYRAAE